MVHKANRPTVHDIRAMKARGQKISMLYVQTKEEAAAAAASGIHMLSIEGRFFDAEMREAAAEIAAAAPPASVVLRASARVHDSAYLACLALCDSFLVLGDDEHTIADVGTTAGPTAAGIANPRSLA